MSTQTQQLLGVYTVAIGKIRECIQEQSAFVQESAEGFKKQAGREATPQTAHGFQPLGAGLANSDEIGELSALMIEDLDGLLGILTARSEALIRKLPK
jgi:hypothetical protein